MASCYFCRRSFRSPWNWTSDSDPAHSDDGFPQNTVDWSPTSRWKRNQFALDAERHSYGKCPNCQWHSPICCWYCFGAVEIGHSVERWWYSHWTYCKRLNWWRSVENLFRCLANRRDCRLKMVESCSVFRSIDGGTIAARWQLLALLQWKQFVRRECVDSVDEMEPLSFGSRRSIFFLAGIWPWTLFSCRLRCDFSLKAYKILDLLASYQQWRTQCQS